MSLSPVGPTGAPSNIFRHILLASMPLIDYKFALEKMARSTLLSCSDVREIVGLCNKVRKLDVDSIHNEFARIRDGALSEHREFSESELKTLKLLETTLTTNLAVSRSTIFLFQNLFVFI